MGREYRFARQRERGKALILGANESQGVEGWGKRKGHGGKVEQLDRHIGCQGEVRPDLGTTRSDKPDAGLTLRN